MAEVTIIGAGLGTKKTVTMEGWQAIQEAQVLIGAERILRTFDDGTKITYTAYLPHDIQKLVDAHNAQRIAVLVSGDSGFYSGAKKLTQVLQAHQVRFISGISALSYFAGQLQLSWEDCQVISLHGRKAQFIGVVGQHEKTFLLLDHQFSVVQVCQQLLAAGLDFVDVYVGERLSYAEEKIFHDKPQNLLGKTYDDLAVMMIINPHAKQRSLSNSLSDAELIRRDIPMTKSEVRAVSLAKLALTSQDIIYDIGAGSGSVTVETARVLTKGWVYAIEKNPLAVSLIQENCRRLEAYNVDVILGAAPAVLADLPVPDAVFIGGTAGKMQEIIMAVLAKNPCVRLVVNAITLETVAETLSCLKRWFEAFEIVQLSVSKNRPAGDKQMMIGSNPVFILSGRGRGEYGISD